MSVSRNTAENFRGRINNGLPAQLLRNQPGAVSGSIWTLAAEALEQLAKPPRPGLVARLKSRVAELEFAVRDLERERDKPPPATVTDVVWKGRAALLAADVARLEAIVSRALDVSHDNHGQVGFDPLGALADELHRAGLYDAEDGSITPAGHALQLRAAKTAPADPARAERVYVAFGPVAYPPPPDPSPAATIAAMRDYEPEPDRLPRFEDPPFSQTTAEAWEEATRARLGYYPGHEPDCAERQTPFGIARCGSKEPDGALDTQPPYFAGFSPVPEAEIEREVSEARAYRIPVSCGATYPGFPDTTCTRPAGHDGPHDDERLGREAPRPLRVYVAGGSSEVELVARYVAALRTAGVEVTYDWTADVLAWRAAGAHPRTPEELAAHARADLDGIERADLVWWILPAAFSEGSAFEAGVAHGLALALARLGHAAPRLVVSGDRAALGRVFPELAAERWDSHAAALAAIVSLAAARRDGGAS